MTTDSLPHFSDIKPSAIKPTLQALLKHNRTEINKLLKQKHFMWENLLQPLEDLEDKITQFWSPIEALNATTNTPALRRAYNASLPLLTEYQIEISQNKALFNAIKKISHSKKFHALSQAHQKTIHNMIHDFQLNGISLTGKNKKRFATLQKELAKLTPKFEENVMDSTHHWHYHAKTKASLKGIPKLTLTMARAQAKEKGKSGYWFGLDFPTYYAVIQYADNPNVRKLFYEAYITRASGTGPHAKKFDNTAVMVKILKIRQEVASLLDYKNYAEVALATNMAKSCKAVLQFLNDLTKRSHVQGIKEFSAIQRFAKKHYGISTLNPWDIAYYSEKLQQHLFDISQEALRPYFPEPIVMQGLFEVVHRLFGITVKEIKDFDRWHDTVKLYAVYDNQDKLVAYFYTDLYARAGKRGGAWMAECRNYRLQSDGSHQIPIAFLNCNFNPPGKNHPCLMTHDEVLTLFHEFGHCLHHMLTTVNVASVSGINGVAWDAVELPSQFLENWCWEPIVIPLISKHYQTGKPLPTAWLKKLIKARNFNSAMAMLRQLEFALFDFKLHMATIHTPEEIQTILDTVRKSVSVIPRSPMNKFQHSFSHIFAGGYAAAYYSYKWAEVLSADAFSLFEEQGIFNKIIGKKFRDEILARGGEVDMAKLFKNFRGRAPNIDALLRHNGIIQVE